MLSKRDLTIFSLSALLATTQIGLGVPMLLVTYYVSVCVGYLVVLYLEDLAYVYTHKLHRKI